MFARSSRFIAPAVVLSVPILFSTRANAQINAYLSAPNKVDIQTFSGVRLSTETFSATAGKYTSNYSSATPATGTTDTANTTVGHGGTYTLSTTNAFQIVADDQYGAGTGNYMSIGAQSGTSGPVTLTFSRTLSYFGMSWNAGDANNGISFYNGTTFVGRYSTANTISALSGTSVTAVNGSTYQTSSYKGKPTGTSTAPSQNTAEPYGYLNFFAANDGSVFNRIVFDNSSTTSTGFETDNHTVVASNSTNQKPTAQGDFVSVGSSVVTPEPGTAALLLPILAGGMVYVRKARRKV